MRNFICGTFLLFTFILYLTMLPEHAVLEGSVHFGSCFFYFVYITELCKVFLEFHDLYSSE